MKNKRIVVSIAMATIMLVSLCAVCASTSVSAAPSNSAPAPGLVGYGIVNGPAVSSWAPDGISLMLFGRGPNNALYSKSYDQIDSVWGHWTSLGGVISSSPAAVSREAGYMNVYARGSNGALYGRSTTDYAATWTPWSQPVAAALLAGTGPAACAKDANTEDLFVTGTNHQLYWSHWTGSWPRFTSLGGYLTSGPAAIYLTDDVIYVCARGGDGALWERVSNNGGADWGAWVKVPGQQLLDGTGPTACFLGSQLWLFVTGTDQKLYSHTHLLGWQSLGGQTTSSPSATIMAGGIQLWVRGTNALPYFNGYYPDIHGTWSWSGWRVIPDNT